MKKEEIQPELQDVIEAINRYVVVNHGNVTFLCSFFAFDEEGELKEDADRIMGYGSKEELSIHLEALYDELENETEDFVNW